MAHQARFQTILFTIIIIYIFWKETWTQKITFHTVFYKPLDIFTLHCFYFPQRTLKSAPVQALVVWLTERLWLQMQRTLSSGGRKLCLNETHHIFSSLSKRQEDKPKCLFFIETILSLGLSSQASAGNYVKAALPGLCFSDSGLIFQKQFLVLWPAFQQSASFFSIFTCRGFIFMIDWVSSLCHAWHDPGKNLMWNDIQIA